jgi:hypothetical protein
MAATQAILATSQATLTATNATLKAAKDSSSMKLIAVLTTLFLPFTFVAVRLLSDIALRC